jgi:hypothetical protein
MKNIFSSRRNKSPHNNEEAEKSEAPFFSKEHKTPFFNSRNNTTVQTKLIIGQPGDKYEKEADAMADAVVNNSSKPDIQNKEISTIQRESLATPQEDEKLGTAEQRMEEDKLVQEKPEIQRVEEPEEEMLSKMDQPEEEKEGMISKMEGTEEEEKPLQTKSDTANATASAGLSQQIKSKSGKGRGLSKKSKTEMESSFGTDFSDVNIHTDQEAIKMNKELGAQAFTHGKDVYFNSGKYNPDSSEGKRLLAHELTHTVQQNSQTIKRKTKVGTKFIHTKGAGSKFKQITANFNGRIFTLFGDSKVLMKTTAQSGRPNTVADKDATKCGGKKDGSYMNNPLYVGIKDRGGIPEGNYVFKAKKIAEFSNKDQNEFTMSSEYFTDPFGKNMHGGDWGSGRVKLSPEKIIKGPKGCGDTSRRSGFYLHGGISPGSSGCIDVGNSGFTSILKFLDGYKNEIKVSVEYTHTAPEVGLLERLAGNLMYGVQE